MATLKRASNDDNGSSSRKSARTSKAPSRLGFDLEPPRSPARPRMRQLRKPAKLIKWDMEEEERNVELAQYNTVLDFVSETQQAQPEFRMSHLEVLRDRDEASKLLREAYIKSYHVHIATFHAKWRILSGAASLDPHWYQRANILTLDYYPIYKTFQEHPVQDAAHFTNYLCKTIPLYLCEPMDQEDVPEYDREYERYATRAETFRKIFLLREALLKSSDPQATRYGLYFSVFMITSILPRRTWEITWHPNRFSGYGMSSSTPLAWGPALHKSAKELLTFLDDKLTPPASDSDEWWTLPQPFFDAGAMYRELFSAYSSHSCEPREINDDENDPLAEYEDYFMRDTNRGRCFHAHIVRLLRALYRHARKEVRVRTLLAAGSFLPVELTDLIVEDVLQAEKFVDEDLIFEPHPLERGHPGGGLRPPYCCPNMCLLPHNPKQRSNTAIRCDIRERYH